MSKLKFNMNRFFGILLALTVATASQSNFAQDAAASDGVSAGRIAVVSVQKAVLQTERAKAGLEKLKEQEDYKANLTRYDDLEAEFKTNVEKYQSDRAVMNAEKIAETEKRLQEKKKDLQWIAKKLQQAEKDWVENIMKEIGEDLGAVLENIVREQKIGLLLRADLGGVVMSADESYDISDQVTERLNQIK